MIYQCNTFSLICMRVVYKKKGLQLVALAFYSSKLHMFMSSIGNVRFVEGDPCIIYIVSIIFTLCRLIHCRY